MRNNVLIKSTFFYVKYCQINNLVGNHETNTIYTYIYFFKSVYFIDIEICKLVKRILVNSKAQIT